MPDGVVSPSLADRLGGAVGRVRAAAQPHDTLAERLGTLYGWPSQGPPPVSMEPMARVPLQQFDIPDERATEGIRSRGLAAQVSPSFHGRNVMGAAEGPMLDGMPAGALFEGYADPTGLEVVSGPSLIYGREQIIRTQRLQAIMEERRRADALAAEEAERIARRDYESFIGPDQPLRATDMYAAPQGFPSQAPGDQEARYDELLRSIAPLQVRTQAADPFQDAADEAVLQRRLDALGR